MNNFWIAIYSLPNECRNYTFKMNFWLNVEIIHFRWHRKDHKSRKLDQNQQLLENNRISLGFKPSLVLFCKCDNPNIWEKWLNMNANLVSMADKMHARIRILSFGKLTFFQLKIIIKLFQLRVWRTRHAGECESCRTGTPTGTKIILYTGFFFTGTPLKS